MWKRGASWNIFFDNDGVVSFVKPGWFIINIFDCNGCNRSCNGGFIIAWDTIYYFSHLQKRCIINTINLNTAVNQILLYRQVFIKF